MDFLKRQFLEDPFYVYFGLALIALGLLAAYRHRPRKQYRLALLAVPVLAVGVFLLAEFVTTERERIIMAMNRVCAGVEQNNSEMYSAHIAPDAQVKLGRWGGELAGRDAIVQRIGRARRTYDVEKVSLGKAEVEFTGEKTAAMRAVTRLERSGGQVQVLTWSIDWIQRDGVWLIYDVYPPGLAGFLDQL